MDSMFPLFPSYSFRNMKVILLYICTWFLPKSPLLIITGWLHLKNCQNFMGTKFFLINLYRGVKNIWGVIHITTHYHSVSFKHFLKKCECISCYSMVSSNLQKMFFIKTSLFELM